MTLTTEQPKMVAPAMSVEMVDTLDGIAGRCHLECVATSTVLQQSNFFGSAGDCFTLNLG
jgi:hypothetical protein